MVLRNALAMLVLSFIAGCIEHTHPIQPIKTVVQVVLTSESAADGKTVVPPTELTRNLERELRAQGLQAVWVDSSTFQGEFASRRSTQGRLRFLAGQLQFLPSQVDGSKGSDLILLVETRSAFYSELEGRFRWVVDVRASIARLSAIDTPVTASFDAPAILNFPHQGSADALRYVSGPLAREVRRLAARYFDESAAPRQLKQAGPPAKNAPVPEAPAPTDGAEGADEEPAPAPVAPEDSELQP